MTCIDPELTTANVRLKLSIEKGNSVVAYSSDFVVGASPIVLTPNIPKSMTSLDLASYFKIENLQGISPTNYGQMLTEGMYRFTFVVIDAVSNSTLSAPISNTFFISLNDPPLLNMPRNAENVQPANAGTPINFQWIPRAAFTAGTEYELSIIELFDGQGSPQQQFQASVPLFKTTMAAPMFSQTGAMMFLQDGHTYAWQVQARVGSVLGSIGLYKNEGKSDVFIFKYQGQCISPSGLQAQAKSADMIEVKWATSVGVHQFYKVSYRKYSSTAVWQWIEQEVSGYFLNLTGLEPNIQYEIKVGGVCSPTLVTYTVPMTVTTLANGEVSGVICGNHPNTTVPDIDPLLNLLPNDIIMAGDFPITIVEATGSNGVFTGKGTVGIPWVGGPKISVKFTNITIDKNKKLAAGFIETTYNPEWKNIAAVDDIIKELDKLIASIKALLGLSIDDSRINTIVSQIRDGIILNLPDELKTLADAALKYPFEQRHLFC